MREPLNNEGFPTCAAQVTSEVGNDAVRNSATNCWNVNFNNGNRNNNNTNNRNFVVGASESVFNEDEWAAAWRNFFKHHHGSVKAQAIYLHPARVLRLARVVASGGFRPRPGYRFPIEKPTPREIHAAFDEDKLVHYYVAPFLNAVSEAVHMANGDISHGNRIGHSAHTGAEQIRDIILEMRDKHDEPYVVKVDFMSCFMSMPRERVYDALAFFARKYYHGEDLEEKLAVCRILVMNDPTKGCLTLEGNWDKVPARKILANAGEGKGIPIGNLYAQIVVNIYLAAFDMLLSWAGSAPRFVDDKVGIVEDVDAARAFVREARKAAASLGLRLHPDKVYIQPAHRGVNFCGRTIKGRRIYLSNRTIKSAIMAVDEAEDALSARDSANSYLGLMKHCTEHKNEMRIAHAVAERYAGALSIRMNGGHPVIVAGSAVDPRKQKEQYIKRLYYVTWENNQRRSRSRTGGERYGSRRVA